MSNQLQDPAAAEAAIQHNVDIPVFFQKLASYGYAPRNDEEAAAMLDMANSLVAAETAQQTKSASAPSEFLASAKANLDRQLGLQPQAEKQASAREDEWAREAARHLTASPDVFNNVLAVKFAEAQTVRTRLGI